MNFIFLVDDYDQWHIDKDTSFALMQGAHQAGHQVFRFFKNHISLENGQISILCDQVIPQANPSMPFLVQNTKHLTEKDIDIIFIRTDPPFDHTYLMTTWLLDQLPKHIPIINKPESIRKCNEKIWAMQFKDLLPPTLLTSQEALMNEFMLKHQNVIIKPTDGFGGKDIHLLRPDTNKRHALLNTLSQNFTREIVLQKYLPESELGDKRVLLLYGEPLGAVLRVHGSNDFRNNFMAGGSAHRTEITDRDYEIIETLRPHLQSLGLYFVGIDIIGGCLTEVNVTSPTCLQEINQLEHRTLERDVIHFAENLIEKHQIQTKI